MRRYDPLTWLIFQLVVILSSVTIAIATDKIAYSAEETAWINSHPDIRLGISPNFEPLLIESPDGTMSGILVDFFDQINRRTNLNIRIVSGNWVDLINQTKEKSIDGIAAIYSESADVAGLLKTNSFMHAYPAIFAHKKTRFQDTDDLVGKQVCYPKGSHFADFILAKYGDRIELIRTDGVLDGLQRVYSGKADYALGLNINDYLLSNYQLSGITPLHVFWDNPGQGVSGIRSDWPELVTILNKAIASFSPADLNALAAKWVNSAFVGQSINWSPEEQAWLDRHPVITLAIDNTYPPLNFTDDDGKLKGLCVDYVDAFARKAGVAIEYNGSIWSIAIKKALLHEVDGVVNADATEERKAYLNFTLPYVTLPCGLVTRRATPGLESITDLGGKAICAKNNSSHLELIANKSAAKVIPIETLEEGLERVIKGESFGVFDDVSALGHLIAKYNFTNLKINFLHYDEIVGVSRLGLRNDDPVMLSVINKAILSLTQKEREEIQSKWLSLVKEKTVIERHFDWLLFMKVVLPILAVAITLYALVLLHNARLRQAVEFRTRDLQKSQAQFRALIDHAADAIFVHDLEGKLLTVNHQACQSLGYSSAELLTMSVTDVETTEWRAHELKQFWKKIVPGQPVTIEGLHRRNDGELFPVEIRVGAIEVEGQPAVLALARDITQRKKEEHTRLLQSAVIAQSHEAVVITDKAGIIQYVNPGFERITGYSRDEAVGKNPRLLKSGRHDDDFYRQLWSTITAGQAWKGHFTNKRKDGSLLVEETTISPITDPGGKIINFAAIKRDITQEQSLERRLRQAQKLEAIGTLAGGIAHDFNNILSAIMGYTELLKMRISQEGSDFVYLEGILKAGDRAKDLVQQILMFSRQTEQEIKPVSVMRIVKEVLKLMRASLPSTIEIEQHLESDALVMADPTQVHQIIMNLCTNAGHAMLNKGGTLQVGLTNTDLDPVLASHYPNLKPGAYLNLSVNDNGHGMPPDVLERIFEPFYTTKDQGEGTGMGLAVVHGIVESFGGMIYAYSEPGKGSSFKVFLPVIESTFEPGKVVEKVLPTGTERILFVDDEPELVKIGKRILENLGYHVHAVTSSTEALEVFAEQSERFDLVISDKTMPRMTGDKLAEKLMAIRKNIPIIMCTGFSQPTEEKKLRGLGIKGLLIKPMIRSQMATMIRQVLDQEK